MPGLHQIDMPDTERRDILNLEGIRQTYDGGKTWIIDGLNLRVEELPDRGRFIVLLGPSGCGKSTIFKYLAGLQSPTEGKVFINERPRRPGDTVGLVFQKYSSFPHLTVLENVMLPLQIQWEKSGTWWQRLIRPFCIFEKARMQKQWRATAMEMITEVGLDGKEHLYADDPPLSGGQKQRVALARSLVATPDIILLDEPFNGLDAGRRFRVQMMLEKLWEKRKFTVILVTHDPDEAVLLGDTLFIMRANPGQIVERIDVDQVLPFERNLETMESSEYQELVARVNRIIKRPDLEAAVA